MVIVVDAGHGGADPGAVYKGHEEKLYALEYAQVLAALLKDNGHTVVETRPDDVYVRPTYRASAANNAHADLFISLHCNSCIEPETAQGVEVLYHASSFRGRMFAKAILDRWYHPVKRGIKPRSDLTVLKQTKMTAVLVEMAFINHSEDIARLEDDGYRISNCGAIADAVEVFDGLV